MLSFSSVAPLRSAEEAQRKIEYIQAELFRVQRACEYREEHPYNPAEAQSKAEGRGTLPHNGKPDAGESSPLRLVSSFPALRVCASNTSSHLASGGDSGAAKPPFSQTRAAEANGGKAGRGGGTTRNVLSFSAFERRRIAQLLGRVAVETAAIWAFVHQWSALGDAAATSPSSSMMNTAWAPARQSSERSTVTTASAGESHDLQPPQQKTRPPPHGHELGDQVGTNSKRATSQLADGQEAVSESAAAQMEALNTLIQTAISIQRMLAGSGGSSTVGWESQIPTSVTNGIHASVGQTRREVSADADAEPYSAVPSTSATQQKDSQLSISPPLTTDLEHTLPGSTSALPLPSPMPPPASSAHTPASPPPPPLTHAEEKTSIPAYLKGYVWEASENTSTEEVKHASDGPAGNDDNGGNEDDDDATVIVVNVDRGDSRSVSAGSTTGANLRSFSRASDAFASSHAESHTNSPSSAPSRAEVVGANGANNNNQPNSNSTRLQGNASSIIAHHRFDSDMGFTTSLSPFRRVISGSSFRSSSLIGSPVQAQQYSHPRSQGYSTSSLHSQPLQLTQGNKQAGSSAGQSPDSAEMSPAAAAAYSRSTSLLRRPHRLEVPISRTQSLRRVPSCTSPTSATGSGSPPSGTVPVSTTGAAFYSHAHVPSQPTAKITGSPPVGLSTSATGDSPHSSITGLHFKRVISVDSENGGWLPGSLADSLDMSHSKPASLLGRPGAPSYSTNVTPSPVPQEAVMTAAAGGADASQRPTSTLSAPTELTMMATYPSAGGGGGADAEGASTASSPLTSSYAVPGRGDSFRGSSVHSRNLTPYYFPSSSGVPARASAPPPPPPTPPTPSRSTMPQSSAGRTPSRPTSASARFTAAPPAQGQPVRAGAVPGGLAKVVEAAPLPPHSYKVDAEKLTTFLQCVRELVQTEFSDDEFDSMHLFYFLPGVSLVRPAAAASEEGSDGPAGQSGSTPSILPLKTHSDDGPLPLFSGGERVPVRLRKLDVFYNLVKRKVQEVCDNVDMNSKPFLSLL